MKYIVSISTLIVALSVAYYLVYYLPHQNEYNRKKLESCLYDAEKAYESVCKDGVECGYKSGGQVVLREKIDGIKSDCSKLYPVK